MKPKTALLIPIALIALAASFIFILTQCRGSLPEGFLTGSYMHNSEVQQLELQNYIQLQPAPDLSTLRRIAFRLVNNTDEMYTYTAQMDLYIWHKDKWMQVAPAQKRLLFSTWARLAPQSYAVIDIFANTGYWGRLPNGEYIAVKRQVIPENLPEREDWPIVIGRFTLS